MTEPGIAQSASPTGSTLLDAGVRQYPLESAGNLRLHNVTAEPAVLDGRRGLRVTHAIERMRRLETTSLEERSRLQIEQLAIVEDLGFSSGIIEAEVAGAPAPGAFEAARGFVGIAFRLQPDMRTYDAFYLRPTNGRAEDQERRNHATQYISHPQWPWARLRAETPSRYEAYVDLVVGAWTRIRIDACGQQARLYVHDQEQPTLIVGLKSPADATGAVALWVGPGTVAHFRGLTVAPAPDRN